MRQETDRTYRERILRTHVHIQENLDTDLSLEELCKISAFSPYHFHRIFSAHVGETVHRHIRRLRLERAAVRLRQTNGPVTQIAFDAGFETHEAFSRAFKDMFGCPPSEFRDSSSGLVKPVRISEAPDARESTATFQPRLESLPERTIAFVRNTGPYSTVGSAFDTLLAWAAAEGLLAGSPQIFGICYDHPDVTPEDKIRYDAAITVDSDITAQGSIGVRTLPGGKHLVVTHQGPYHEVGPAYDFIYGSWLPAHHRLPADMPPFEVYLNDPHGTDPEDLLTDIYLLLEPTGSSE